MFHSGVILLWEIRCWSLFGVKGLRAEDWEMTDKILKHWSQTVYYLNCKTLPEKQSCQKTHLTTILCNFVAYNQQSTISGYTVPRPKLNNQR